ncbi:hypothetical protein HMPREF1624_06094 [Sporothrix schenckii ATCC 58251]|uniref:PAS domain-containing protein n=1 Tax=Sporothrix schenckii (strain ATCC 58251 / de Perez 2211183) TaxID=1391915 RepID=U7PQM5_SPOS1|nr:hypothetical protein HMPREF1624_06094 [Sporothrix schenckii ATCC 58251]
MFATTSISTVLGLRPHEIKNKGFYRCIQESCLSEAIECLESAKANDSIAYLRFFFQDPREDDELAESMANGNSNVNNTALAEDAEMAMSGSATSDMDVDEANAINIKVEVDDDAHFSLPSVPLVSEATTSDSPGRLPSIELEAVVSCTSDGLVVILRKARPPIPPAHPPLVAPDYGDGLFAAPWGQQPIQPHFPKESLYTFRAPLLRQYMPLRQNVKDAGGPPLDTLMGSIRDVAVFAWGVVGINPALAAYGRGLPSGEARPISGSRPGCQQTRHGSTNDNTNTATFSKQDKGKAPENEATSQPRTYTARRVPADASHSALDPVRSSIVSNSCGYQSMLLPSTGSNWGYTHSPETTAALMEQPQTARNLQQLPQNYSSSFPPSSSSPNAPFRRHTTSRGTGYQPPSYGSPVAQGPSATTTGSTQDRHFG